MSDVRFALILKQLGAKITNEGTRDMGGREIAGTVWALGKICRDAAPVDTGGDLTGRGEELGRMLMEAGKDSVSRTSKIWVEGTIRVAGGIVGVMIDKDKAGGKGWKEQVKGSEERSDELAA